jgi:predicted transcriptional regulator
MFWYTDPKESVEEKVLQSIATEGQNFSREMFKAALESIVGMSSNNAVSNWLERMIKQGLINKIGHGQYRKMETELDSLGD